MSLIITYTMARGFLIISQRAYIENALKVFGFENLKSAETPFAVGVKFTSDDMPTEVDETRKNTFLRMIGVARWVTRNACPEATFAVAYLSCFMASPSKGMMTALVRVFRYFKWALEQDVDAVQTWLTFALCRPCIAKISTSRLRLRMPRLAIPDPKETRTMSWSCLTRKACE